MHISKLPGDYFIFDDKNYRMTGTRTGTEYVLGQKVRIRVAGVDEKTCNIDFDLVTEDSDPGNERGSEDKKASPAKHGQGHGKSGRKTAGPDGRIKKRRTAGNGSGKTGKRKTDERRTKKTGSK